MTEGYHQWEKAATTLHSEVSQLIKDRLHILGMTSVHISMIIPERTGGLSIEVGDLFQIVPIKRLFLEDSEVYIETGRVEEEGETDVFGLRELTLPEVMEVATQIISGSMKQPGPSLENKEDDNID